MSSWSSIEWTTLAMFLFTRQTISQRQIGLLLVCAPSNIVSKLGISPADPSKPLLAVIIERLCSGIVPKPAASSAVTEKPKIAEKEKEAIDSSLSDLKKFGEPKEVPPAQVKSQLSLNSDKPSKETAPAPAPAPKAKMELPEIPPRKEAPKMMGAKKESEEPAEK